MTMQYSGSQITFPDNSTLQQRFLEAFDYRDGKLFWKINTNPSKNLVGKEAGCKSSGSYGLVNLDGVAYCLHKVIFCMHRGYIPEVVDHINGIGRDHRIENLRASDHSTNNCNKAFQKNNTSGVKGLTWSKQAKKWQARITFKKKHHHLGYFDCKDDAAEFLALARDTLHGDFANHGAFA